MFLRFQQIRNTLIGYRLILGALIIMINIMKRVKVFFYGSYMNLEVLKGIGLRPKGVKTAILPGFTIQIQPLANIYRNPLDVVYGIVAELYHQELSSLYSHASGVLGGDYHPQAVVVSTPSEEFVTAMCYIAHEMPVRKATREYVEHIVGPAQGYLFPKWYMERLESFMP